VYDITVVVHALVYLYVYSDTIQGKCRPLLFPKEQFVKSIWDKYNRMEVFCGVARVQAIAIANRHEDKGRCVQLEHAKKQEELERPL